MHIHLNTTIILTNPHNSVNVQLLCIETATSKAKISRLCVYLNNTLALCIDKSVDNVGNGE